MEELIGVSLLMLAIMGPMFWFISQMVKQKNQVDIEKLKLQQATLAAAAGIANPAQQAQQAAQQQAQAELIDNLKKLNAELTKQNARLQNLESIVTSPGFLVGQGLSDSFHALTEEQQAAELAKQIAAREGRTT